MEPTLKVVTHYQVIIKEIRKLKKLHFQNPTLHEWVPIQVANFDPKDYEMLIGCRCGTTVWIPAEKIAEI